MFLFEVPSDAFDVREEATFGAMALLARRTEDRGWMHRCERERCPLGFDRHRALLQDTERPAEQCFRRGRSETEDRFWPHDGELGLEPREARFDFRGVWRSVQSPGGSCLACPLEVFDRVRDVDFIAIDAGGLERAIEQSARRTNEGMPGAVLGVAGLFADHEQNGVFRTFTEYGLRAELEEVASATVTRGSTQLRQGRSIR